MLSVKISTETDTTAITKTTPSGEIRIEKEKIGQIKPPGIGTPW